MSFPEAQEHANFVVFAPTWLPADCTLTGVSLRPEQPPGRPGGVTPAEIGQTPWSSANPCSVRAIVAGHGRRLRLKQFLYDWAPPAASTAPLWNSPRLTPIPCRDAVAWLGTDYMDRHGACVQLLRTQIEVSVSEGVFADEEIGRLLSELAPAAPDVDDPVRRAPFHRLSYWGRYALRPVAVPHGLWDFSQTRRYDCARVVSLDDLRAGTPVLALLPVDGRYSFDSAAIMEDTQAGHREVELIYRHTSNGSDHLWLLAVNRDSGQAPALPPRLSTHPAEVRTAINLRSTTIHYAALDTRHGAWEAFWEEGDTRYALWACASQFMNADIFMALISTLQPA
jgi:hypothetical protein